MWITGMKGMKEMTAKYHVVQYVRNSGAASPIPVSTGTTLTSSASSTGPSSLNADESYAWKMYGNSLPGDKDYIQVFCGGNPKGAALLPHSKVIAGQSPEHALDCASWISAKAKNNNEATGPAFDARSNNQRDSQITGGTIPVRTDKVTTNTAATVSTKSPFTVQQVGPSKKVPSASASNNSHGWIGITSKQFGSGGAVVTAVAADGPASKAGLKPGDVINEVNGIPLKDEDLNEKIATYKPGANVRLGYMRGS
jgi:hypothetical protein